MYHRHLLAYLVAGPLLLAQSQLAVNPAIVNVTINETCTTSGCIVGQTQVNPASVSVTSTGSNLQFTATSPEPWIQVNGLASVTTGTPASLSISVNASGAISAINSFSPQSPVQQIALTSAGVSYQAIVVAVNIICASTTNSCPALTNTSGITVGEGSQLPDPLPPAPSALTFPVPGTGALSQSLTVGGVPSSLLTDPLPTPNCGSNDGAECIVDVAPILYSIATPFVMLSGGITLNPPTPAGDSPGIAASANPGQQLTVTINPAGLQAGVFYSAVIGLFLYNTSTTSINGSPEVPSNIIYVPVTYYVPGLLITTNSALPPGIVGVNYSQSLTATGGTPPYTWSVPSGSLPPGLSLTGNTISGTPQSVGSRSFVVTVTDSNVNDTPATQSFSLTILATPPTAISSLTPTSATAGGPAFNLMVNGTGFVNGATVNWVTTAASTALSTTFVSATQLTAAVPAALIATGVGVYINVTGPGGAVTNSLSFTIAAGAAPVISGLTPASVNAGGPAFTLGVIGSGFVNGATVNWLSAGANTALSTIFGGTTQLLASVPVALIATAGTASVTVTNPGGPVSAASTFTITSPNPTYYFSQLAVGGGFQTTLTYINYSPQTVTCTTSFNSDAGGVLPLPFNQGTISTRTDVLPPGGSIHDQTISSLTAAVTEGWAQASCTAPVQANILYRLYQTGLPAGAAPVPLGEASLNAETVPASKFVTFAQTNTGVAYANPSTTQSAVVTFTVFNSAGVNLGSTNITLGPLQHSAANLGPLLDLASFVGSVQITSTSPIISLSLNAEAFPVFSALPPGDLSGSASTAAQNYYFSQLAVGGGFQTTLTYINYSPQTVTCTTSFNSDAGGVLPLPFDQGTISTRTDVLPPGGSIHDQTISSLTAGVTEGWAQASCTAPVQANILYRLYQTGLPAGAAPVPLGEASLNAETVPASKFVTFAQTNTGVAYANPSTTQSAVVTFTVFNAAGVVLGSTNITLGPLQHSAANLGPLLGLGSFVGSVQITSTSPIISLSLNAEAFPVFSALPPGDLSSSTVLVSP